MGLNSFGEYQRLRKQGFLARDMGFRPRNAGSIINTLNARVRVAKSFQGLQLEGYRGDTVAGYSALFQVFLTYSAFEQFLRLLSLKQPSDIEILLVSYQPELVADQIRSQDKQWKFLNFLLEKVDSKKLRDNLEDFKLGQMNNPAILASAVRHIFAHGHLTSYAKGARPNVICPICHSLSDFLLDFMDTEFTNRIESAFAKSEI